MIHLTKTNVKLLAIAGNFAHRFQCSYLLLPALLLFLQCLFTNSVNGQCATPNTTLSPATAVNAGTGVLVNISTTSREGQYSIVTGIVSGAKYKFTISLATDIITVRTGSSTGTTLGFGTGSVTVTATSNSDLYIHWNTTGCGGSGATNRTTTVQGIPTIISLGASSGCVGSSITINGANFTGAVASGVTIGGTPVSALTTNTATQIIGTIASGTTGIVSVTATGGTGTSASSFTVNQNPTNLTPTAQSSVVCSGSGTNIQVPSSQLGVDYQLRNNSGNATIGGAVSGTGGTINLPTGNLTANTTFNVLATNTTTGCFTQLSSTVTVSMDNIAPTITCPANQTINLNASCAATMPSYTSMATVADNCTATGAIIITQSPAAGTALSGAGGQAIILTATDASGNSSNCTFTLTKQDVTPPVISCPSNITTNASAGICGAVVNYTISATDNCTGSTSCIPASMPNYVLVGTYGGHTYYRSTISANWATAKANAIALGGHLLTLSSIGENNLFNGLGSHWAGFTDEAVEGTFVWVTGEPVVFTNWAPGEPNDYNGNEDHMQINWNTAYNWNDYDGASAYPYIVEFECVSPTLTRVSGLASGSVFPTGTSTVVYNATDGNGNTSANCSFTVTVNDVTPPTIACPANISVNAAAGACDAVVNYNAPVASDNCGTCSTAPTITGFASLGINNGKAYYISTGTANGPTAFSNAIAAGGQMATISSAADNTFIRNAANGLGYTGSYLIGINDVATEGSFVWASGVPVSYTNWNAGEPNNSGGDEDYTQILNSGVWNDINSTTASNYIIEVSCITPVKNSGLASGSTFPLGTSTINYSATDPSGNTANCSFTVTVSLNPASLSKTLAAAASPLCAGTGTNITVASSDNGISYQLRNNSNNANIGSPVTGTGGTINLPTGNLSATTTFNVFATGSSCSYQLANTVTVTVNAGATVVAGSTLTACQSATPSAITLTGASVGGSATTGQWSITSGGGTLSNYSQTATPATVTYTPVANYAGTVTLTLTTNYPGYPCVAVADTRTITVNTAPTVTPGATLNTCQSATPSAITLAGASFGGSATSAAWSITAGGGTLSSTAQTVSPATVTYTPDVNYSGTVTLTLTSTGGLCSAASGSRTINVNALPADKTPAAASATICSGTATNIQITASQTGVNYQLRNNATNANIGAAVAGNAGTINLPTGNLTANTTFNVLATNVSTACFVQMINTVTVSIYAAATVTPGSTLTACQSAVPSAITLAGAAFGGSATTAAWSITSGGGTLSSTAQTATPASVTYTPAANFSGTVTLTLTTGGTCTPAASNTRTITVGVLPTNKTPAASSAAICSGSGTNIQVPASEVGVNYQLRNNAGNALVGTAVAGNGGTINLPTGNLTATTIFNVLATNATTSCSVQMTATVTVSMDNIAPVITCPATQTLSLNSSCTATLPGYTSLATVSDNCTATGSITVTQSPVAGSAVSGTGTQLITLTATDASGNSSTCTFNVTKQDVTPPVMSCPSNITANSTAGICGAVVNYTVSATDNCSGSSCAPSSIAGFTLIGTYGGHTYFRSTTSALWPTAKANAISLGAHLATIASAGENTFLGGLGQHWGGMTDEASEGTWVWVTGEPVVYTSWNAGEPNNSGGAQNYQVLNYSGTNWDDQGTATSTTLPYIIEFDCLTLNLVSGYASGTVFPMGTTTVTYNATDAAGNTSPNCSFTVTVNDVTPPTIVCPANISVNAAAGACTALVNYNTPVVNDNCGSCSSAPAITGFTSLGIYNGNAYYVSNAAATCSAAFTNAASVGAAMANVLTAGENTFIRNAANAAGFTGSLLIGFNDVVNEGTFVWNSGATPSYTNWTAGEPNNSGNDEDYTIIYNNGLWNDVTTTASNNYVIEVSCITPTRTSGLASGSTFPLGISTISYSAADPSGNTATCSFTVTVAINPASLSKTVAAVTSPLCAGTATNITVAASDNGISYQLRNNATNATIGSAVTGTGGTINLPTGNLNTTTTFNVYATGSSCSYQLTNTVTVTVNAAATVTPGTALSTCQSATPAAITLSGASVGGGATTGAWSITSVGGGTLSNTGQTGSPAIVTYTPAANFSGTIVLTLTSNTPASPCAVVSATRNIVINPLPTNKTPAASSASVCPNTGTNIQILLSQSGVNYQLRNNTGNTLIGTAVAGTGATINLPTGNLSAATTFNVLATDATTGCNIQMTGTVTVTMNALPTDKTPTAVSSAVCSGTSTSIQIASSQSGVNYQLRNNADNSNIGSAVAGTGLAAPIVFSTGMLTANTTFNVLATTVSTGCSAQMVNTVTVTVNAMGLWVGSTTGDWNTSTNWCGGVPTSSTNVNIPAGTTVNIQSANAVANSVTIAGTGSLVMTGANNLNITAGGTFTNNGTFTATSSTGTVAFLGNGIISGTTTFKNIDTYGALDFGTASTVAGTFSLQTGGSVTGHSPTYTCPTAVLLYKPGTTFTRGLEWTNSSSGAGYPANVWVQNNTTINFPAVGDGYICYDLTIDNGSGLMQDFSGGSAALRVGRNVTITGTLSLGSAGGGDIYVGGNWTRNTGGVFNANDRKVTFDGPSNFSGNGTSMSTITAPASPAKDNEGGFGGEKFAHIWVNKTNTTDSVVLLSNITITRELGFTKGTFSLRNSDVTMVSNKTRTADIATIATVANVAVRYGGTGKFVIQRFIQNPTAVRSWRLLGAPLQSATAPTLNEAYQEGVVNPDRENPNASGGIYNPWPGYGVHITGPGGTYSLANGFDQGTNTASVLYANTGVSTWTSPASTTGTKITDKQGWMVFVRGDRGFAIGNQYVASQNTTLEPKGRINIGNVLVPVTAAKQVIANPYPSAISLLNVDVAGTLGKNSTYYMWDPKMFTSYTQPGKWVTFTGTGSSFVQTTSESAYPSNGTIESGQAFVLNPSSAGNVTFHETDKLSLNSSLIGIANGNAARPSSAPMPMFRSDIYANNSGAFSLTDAVLNIFDESYSNNTDIDDAGKVIIFNTKESLSILRDTAKLAIEKRKNIQVYDTIFYSMTKFNEIPYRFRFAANNFAPGMEAYLEDKFNHNRTQLSTTDTSVVDFSITADPLSKAEDRFRVVFKAPFGNVLPVTFTNVKAYQQIENIAVEWKVANELNIKQYEVEKSLDGNHFEKVNTTLSLGNYTGNRSYQWLDKNAAPGINYYRILARGLDAGKEYSQVVDVNMPKVKGGISVYPNPITDGIIRLGFENMDKGNYAVRLLNTTGQTVLAMNINHAGGSTIKEITAGKTFAKGIYNLEVNNSGKEKMVVKVMIE